MKGAGMNLRRFRRITASGSYMGEVDGLRFVAISSVFLFHLGGDVRRHSSREYNASLASDGFADFISQLNLGVQLFFVLSGFILGLPFARHHLCGAAPVRLKRYIFRRLTRLEPPYVAALLLFFVLKVVGGRGSPTELLPHLGASAAYAHNWVFGVPSKINFVAWSLEVEVQFYLLAPFLAKALYRQRRAALRRAGTALFCVGSAYLASIAPDPAQLQLSLVGQLSYFAAGMLLADVHCTHDDVLDAGRVSWDLLCLLLFAFLFVSRATWFHWSVTAALCIAASYHAMFRGVWVRRALAWPPVATIGGMCYSIYLLHNYAIALCGMVSERLGSTLPFAVRLGIQSLFMAPLVLLIGGGFYLLVERPCMRPDWPQRAWRKLREWGGQLRSV